MPKRLFVLFSFFAIFFSVYSPVLAINDPASVSNNKVGIHITNESDLNDAAALTNTNGGDWGYVTFVITESERDHDRWQKVFDQMRRVHLIPIVRLATKPSGDTWNAPNEAEINNWVAFLNNLNWVIQNRYVIINNEPNHAKEWGGRLDPAGYAKYLKEFSQKLKSASPDFFVLSAGIDPAASNKFPTMSSAKFITEMKSAQPDVFNYIDGWTSHPYPAASLSSYNSELSLVGKRLPVFVTETGWSSDKYGEPQIAENIVNAYTNVWNDPRVIAVTPFILNYTSAPFNIFSWKKSDGSFYAYYSAVQKMAKVKGEPVQIESGQIFGAFAQPVMLNGMDFVGAILAKNTGQTIWSPATISIASESQDFALKSFSLNNIEPGRLGLIFFKAAKSQDEGVYTNSLFLTGVKNQKITNSFSIEAALFKLDINQVYDFLGKIFQKW